VCGSPTIDIDVLKANTMYSGCSVNDVHVQYLWKILESFTQVERSQYLRFVWGRSRLPAKLTGDKMKIQSAPQLSNNSLPVSHTWYGDACMALRLVCCSGFC
jgi:hypothetical protein